VIFSLSESRSTYAMVAPLMESDVFEAFTVDFLFDVLLSDLEKWTKYKYPTAINKTTFRPSDIFFMIFIYSAIYLQSLESQSFTIRISICKF
jgi:hypothetical protein